MDMNIIFPTTLLYDFMRLQFISDVYEKNTQKNIKWLNIANKVKIVSNLSISIV
jgi:hypothetical protein